MSHIKLIVLLGLILFIHPLPANTILPNTIKVAPWSDAVFKQLEADYGKKGANRMRKIYRIIQENQNVPIKKKLEIANRTLNSLPWIMDKRKWSQDDYWATPLESIATFGGDCEDIALGKLAMLRLMGVPKKNLFLGYVKVKKTREIHMVLVWANNDRNQTLVLDNIVKTIKPGPIRTDLIAVYLTDMDGNLIVLHDDGKKRRIKGEISEKKLKKLEEVKRRSRQNVIKYTKANGGKPLYFDQ